MLYKILGTVLGLLVAFAGIWLIRGALGYFIESLADFIFYFIHNITSVFIFAIGLITALITIGEVLEKKT